MRKALLFFVHGLGGNSTDTWGEFRRLIDDDEELREIVDTGFFEYPTSLFRLPFARRSVGIQDLASGLKTELDNRFPEYLDIVLVCHSLGGLIARRYVLDEIKNDCVLRCRNLLLYAVPNNGAGLAAVGNVISWRHNQLRQLCEGADLIDDLNEDWFRRDVPNLIGSKFVVAGQDRVVDRTSAKLFWGNLDVETVVDRGHRDVVKPRGPQDIVYLILKRFTCEALGGKGSFGWRGPGSPATSDEERVRIGGRVYVTREVIPGVDIPDDDPAGIESSIQIDSDGVLRDVIVGVKVTHTYTGDLFISIVSPSGTEVCLKDREGGSARSGDIVETYDLDSSPGLSSLTDESVQGDWKLRVVDNSEQDVGRLEKWGIKLLAE